MDIGISGRHGLQSLYTAFRVATATIILAAVSPVAVAPASEPNADFFETRIRPVLAQKCGECHSGDTPEGDFRVEGLADLLTGGASGPALIVAKPDSSELIRRLETDDEELRMPPDEPLSADVIANFRKWISEGAVWPTTKPSWEPPLGETDETHWAFRPLADVTPPQVPHAAWRRTEIDRFISAKFEKEGLAPVPPADKRTLIRRATLDLTGLPPTPEEVQAFLADHSANAFDRVIDRLLGSEAYGERWGRHWLDLARYADTSGDGTDMPIPEARYYRDYVIAAFNRDMPYDQFLIEQLAGDILAKQNPDDPRNHEKVIATGYIALSRRFGNSRFAEMELIIDDTIDTLGRSVLGLTLGCARCHHHKFDPVTMEDYYGLYGYFASTQYPHAGTEHQKERSDLVPLSLPADLATVYESPVAWAVSDKTAAVGDARIHIAGDANKKGDVAPRSFLSVIDAARPQIAVGSSGRLELARWVASPDNPLTMRVIVNRVWQYHFGKGLVATSSNFGRQSPPPSHPELLDWLARDFIDHRLSLKHLHRRIMSSAVYQLGSTHNADNAQRDEANRLYWRFDRQRMDAETLRDSLLAVSGSLERGSGGRHPFKPTEELKYTQGNPFTETFEHNRRSVYLMNPRLNKHPFMALYDGPDTNKSTEQRAASTVSLQSLHMLNSAFIEQQAAAFAARISAATSDVAGRLQLAYELALARPPDETERARATGYLQTLTADLQSEGRPLTEAERLAWTSFARALLASNEFIYVD